MKISYNWLKQYINVDLEPNKVAHVLTDTGLEVEGIETVEVIKGGLKGVVIGEVLSKEQHPNADRDFEKLVKSLKSNKRLAA